MNAFLFPTAPAPGRALRPITNPLDFNYGCCDCGDDVGVCWCEVGDFLAGFARRDVGRSYRRWCLSRRSLKRPLYLFRPISSLHSRSMGFWCQPCLYGLVRIFSECVYPVTSVGVILMFPSLSVFNRPSRRGTCSTPTSSSPTPAATSSRAPALGAAVSSAASCASAISCSRCVQMPPFLFSLFFCLLLSTWFLLAPAELTSHLLTVGLCSISTCAGCMATSR